MKRSLRKRALLAMVTGGLVAAMLPGVAAADGVVNRYEVYDTLFGYYGDKTAFGNITRAELCTPYVLALEQWWLDGAVGDPPEGQWPQGEKPISIKEEVTGQGAIVSLYRGSDLTWEWWNLDDPANPTGLQCHDTAGQQGPWATGTISRVQITGNDASYHDPGSGTRGKEASVQGFGTVTDADGTDYRFHVVEHYSFPRYSELLSSWVWFFTLEPMH